MNKLEVLQRTTDRLKLAWHQILQSNYDKMYFENKDEIWSTLGEYGKDCGFLTIASFITHIRDESQRFSGIKTRTQYHNLLLFAFVALNAEEQTAENNDKSTYRMRGLV